MYICIRSRNTATATLLDHLSRAVSAVFVPRLAPLTRSLHRTTAGSRRRLSKTAPPACTRLFGKERLHSVQFMRKEAAMEKKVPLAVHRRIVKYCFCIGVQTREKTPKTGKEHSVNLGRACNFQQARDSNLSLWHSMAEEEGANGCSAALIINREQIRPLSQNRLKNSLTFSNSSLYTSRAPSFTTRSLRVTHLH